MIRHAPEISSFRDLDRWHELLTHRYVCENCLTRYFMSYRRCKACGAIGRIHLLTVGLFDLADSEMELRNIIAHGQRLHFMDEPPPIPTLAPPDFSEGPP